MRRGEGEGTCMVGPGCRWEGIDEVGGKEVGRYIGAGCKWEGLGKVGGREVSTCRCICLGR